ncbi:MAG: acetoacetate--CoA ligase [Pseudomonadota bacterium]|nr:acetoacetate--CoA ligase [Pseudomonadota bacterium]
MTASRIPTEGELLWRPAAADIDSAQITSFVAWLAEHRGLHFPDYPSLWRWSVDETEAFWGAVWDYFRVISDAPWERVLDPGRTMQDARWFKGTRTNYAEHILRHEAHAAAGKIAVWHCSEQRELSGLSWQALGDQVRKLATSLREMGIGPGDRVVSYMPNVPETLVAMLATVSIGAIWSSAAPEFGVKTVVDRFSQIEPRLMFVADGYSFSGKTVDRRDFAQAIVERLPTLQAVVWLPCVGLECRLQARARIVEYTQLLQRPSIERSEFRFERVAHDHPLWVLFSSGTTGVPKAIVHGHVGVLVELLKVMHFHLNVDSDACMFFYTTTGWMMWNTLTAGLLAGSSVVLYDGNPMHPGVDRLWRIVEASGATLFAASPGLVQKMKASGLRPAQDFDLSRLRTVLLGGAPSTPEHYHWLYEEVGSRLWVTSQSGGTEVCSSLVGGVPTLPVYAGEIQAACLGMAVQAWNDNGDPVTDETGELVVTRPFPSMPLFFWNDAGHRRYTESYFSSWPGVWRHGDQIKFNARGGAYVYGRSDATLNRYGVRIGTAEVYSCVEQLDGVQDSLVICCEYADGSSFMPLFVLLAPDRELDEALTSRIVGRLKQEASPRHAPDAIYAVPAIPYTLTGKKMEVPVRKILLGADPDKVASRDTMANPAALDWYVGFADTLRRSDRPSRMSARGS